MNDFKKRWNIKTNWQLVVIFIVFAITGSTSAIISKPVLYCFGISKDSISIIGYYLCYIIIIFPIYQILLVTFGYLFGQFDFFWKFEKKMLHSMRLGFLLYFFENKKKD